MKLLNLTVPQEVDVRDFLADLKEKTNAWIFLHETTVNLLSMEEGVELNALGSTGHVFSWKTDEGIETRMIIRPFEVQTWYTVVFFDIQLGWIDYIEDPDYIIRIKKAI